MVLNEWFDRQAPELQKTIAFAVLIHLPGFDSDKLAPALSEFVAAFRGFLEVGEEDIFKILGTAIIFRGLISFACRTYFSGYQSQCLRDNELIGNGSRKENLEDLAAIMEKEADEMRLRAARWLKAGEAFNRLCENELSDAALALYLSVYSLA